MTPSPGRRGVRTAVLALTGLALILGVVFLLPIPHDYTLTIPAVPVCGPATRAVSYPAGAIVSGSWRAVGNVPVEFEVRAPPGDLVYDANGTAGSYSFTATTGSYLLEALPSNPGGPVTGCVVAPTVQLTGTWSATAAQMAGI